MQEDDPGAIRAELARVLGILGKIRAIIECPDPRFNGLWYQVVVKKLREYLTEAFSDDREDTTSG